MIIVHRLRIFLMTLFLALCAVVTYYFHYVLGVEVVYTHLFYVPIVLAGMWWGIVAIFVSVFLALALSGSHILSGVGYPVTEDLIRGVMFIFVGSVVGIMIEERDRLEREALMEKNSKMSHIEKHVRYLEKTIDLITSSAESEFNRINKESKKPRK